MLTSGLAAEHRRDLVLRASAHRTARARATPARPRVRASWLTVVVRPLRPGDSALLADVFAGLSPASRSARFLGSKPRLTAAELRYFTDVDHHDHEALIAVSRWHGEPLGVARFVRDLADPTSAEVAFEVVDEWQGRGVGSLLMTYLSERARCEHISQFTALLSADNYRSRRLLATAGVVTTVSRDGATVSYRVALPARSRNQPPHAAPLEKK